MENNKTYNGWTNYPTWCAALWIENDERTYYYWRKQARSRDEYDVASELSEAFTSGIPESTTGVYQDLLQHALSEVDWSEIVQHLQED